MATGNRTKDKSAGHKTQNQASLCRALGTPSSAYAATCKPAEALQTEGEADKAWHHDSSIAIQ
eukprot:6173500-Pleurochrysis_carterae.AAC.2